MILYDLAVVFITGETENHLCDSETNAYKLQNKMVKKYGDQIDYTLITKREVNLFEQHDKH